ncbi:TetR family transcriptional regulator [Globicatella sulfidifaciens]
MRISKKTIYQYFPSKKAILNEVVDDGFWPN